MSDLQTLATEARTQFRKIKRGEEEIWTRADEAPEWVRELCHEAHGDMLPDDWRYAFIVEALDALEEHDEDEARDSLEADIYTSDLCAWLASRADRTCTVDEACEEFGPDAPQTIVARIQMGQLAEKREVFAMVVEFLVGRIEEEEDEEEGPDEEDVITEDFRTFRLANGGTVAFTVPDDGDWEQVFAAWCEREQFWPNAWRLDDHGSIELLKSARPKDA